MIERLHGYPKVWNLGHKAIADLFDGPVVIQEKVDGSQFTFGVIGGELKCRSKRAEVFLEEPDRNFALAVETVKRVYAEGKLTEGWQYRGEAFRGYKHNALEYDRAPRGNLILFDVDTGLEDRVADPERLASIAEDLGLEVVPTLVVGPVEDLASLTALLETPSILGKALVEGIVIKNYDRFNQHDGKMLMGKLVSAEFREKHAKSWKKTNPGKGDVVALLKEQYRSERRWEKSVERLGDEGLLDDSPKDIGLLLREVQKDIYEECGEEIKEALFKAFWKEIGRGTTAGLPEWYKNRLAESQFTEATE